MSWHSAASLGMGDVYSDTEGSRRYTIQHVQSVRGGFYFLHWREEAVFHKASLIHTRTERVWVVKFAPRCRCETRYELCEAGCRWPADLRDLFLNEDGKTK